MSNPIRFSSVDALRGITVAAMLLVNNPGDWGHVYAPLLHSQWHGCTPTDLIFPFFLFIVGVSIALGVLPRKLSDPALVPQLQRALLIRALRIIAVGLVLHLLAWWWLDRPEFRPWGVLQRIGLCFGIVGVIALHTGARVQNAIIVLLLASYALLLQAGGSLQPWLNLPSRIDTALFAPLLYQFDAASGHGHDPEGLVSTLGALATTLIGLRAGDLLRQGRAGSLLPAAAALLVAGWLWAQWQPLNKNLWTPSYVLWTAGWALLALWGAHRLIDQRGWPALGRRFGVNAITAYAGSSAMVLAMAALGIWPWLYTHVFDAAITPLGGPKLASLAFALAFVLLWWLPMWWLDRKRIYLKI